MRLGIDLGGTKIEAALLGDDGQILMRERTLTPHGNYQGTLQAIAQLLSRIDQKHQTHKLPVGVGIPGAISPKTGLVKNANSVCLIGNPLDRDLEKLLGRPVRLENDANCFVLSEAVDGAGREARVVFGVILGTGVGGGVVFERKLWRGGNLIAGEWGHNPLPWPNDEERKIPTCYCGKTGCIESFLSGPALEARYLALSARRAMATDLVELARAGDTFAEQALSEYEIRLARALAGVINILDPDVIVLGGGVSNVGRWYESVPRLWQKFVFSDEVATRLKKAEHGDSSGVRGAAWL